MHTTRTPRSSGLGESRRVGAGAPTNTSRKRPPRVALVVACSHRKRVAAPNELRLSSIEGPRDERAVEWGRRIREIDAATHRAQHLYVGDHWRSACKAYRLALQYSSRAELWVMSAGYGLIASNKLIKPYSATFASGVADSVWRGPSDGARPETLRRWWNSLKHDVALDDLHPIREADALVIAVGADYLTALEADLQRVFRDDVRGDRVSVISAGTRGDEPPLLPVSGRFRVAVGGTDAALNARLLAFLARDAGAHQFQRSAMAAALNQMAAALPSGTRRAGKAAADAEIAVRIHELRQRLPGISRTSALRQLRAAGIACEQSRFASIWNRVA